MRQFEIRERDTDALIVIVDCETIHEAWVNADWWADEFGVQVVVAREITK